MWSEYRIDNAIVKHVISLFTGIFSNSFKDKLLRISSDTKY